MPAPISLVASTDPTVRRAVRLLRMVHELHKAGYQLLRICPGCSVDLRNGVVSSVRRPFRVSVGPWERIVSRRQPGI